MSKLERLGPIKYADYCALSSFVKSIPFAYFEAVGNELFDEQKKLYGRAVDLSLDLDLVVFGLGSIADINSDDRKLFFKKLMRYYKLDFSPNVFNYTTRCNYGLHLQKLLIKCSKYLEKYYENAASSQEYMWLKVELNSCLDSHCLNNSESNLIRAFYLFACYIFSATFILQKLHAYWLKRDDDGQLNNYLVCRGVLQEYYYVPAIKDLNPTWKQIDLIECF